MIRVYIISIIRISRQNYKTDREEAEHTQHERTIEEFRRRNAFHRWKRIQGHLERTRNGGNWQIRSAAQLV